MTLKHLILLFPFVFSMSAYSQGQFDPVKPNEFGCLQREWAQISPTEVEKAFDIANDFDDSGERISCNNFITPTELNNFFVKVKRAVKENNKEALADLVLYPTRTLLDGMENIPEGNRDKVKSRDIKDKKYFIDHYDEIMLPTTIKIIQCLQLNTIFAHPYMGTGTHAGEFWFYRDVDTRKLSIYRLSSRPETDKHWLEKDCSW